MVIIGVAARAIVVLCFSCLVLTASEESDLFFKACRHYLRVVHNSGDECKQIYNEFKLDETQDRRKRAILKYVEIPESPDAVFSTYGKAVNMLEPLRKIHSSYCIYLSRKFLSAPL